MTASTSVFPPSSEIHQRLLQTAQEARCAAICGVPGMGKSLLLREQALIAQEQGRTVHRLQWDVARQPFERADILARYPEIEGSTHPVIRRAVGIWVRRAVAEWFEGHPDPSHLLLIEAPLVGGRFIEVAQAGSDAAEAHLAAESTHFLVPVPSREVRTAIQAARMAETAVPQHARDAANALPTVVDALWQELVAAARALWLAVPEGEAYSPALYWALCREVLCHRQVHEVPVTAVLSNAGSPHAHPRPSTELVPGAQEVSGLIDAAEAEGVETVIAASEVWYRL